MWQILYHNRIFGPDSGPRRPHAVSRLKLELRSESVTNILSYKKTVEEVYYRKYYSLWIPLRYTPVPELTVVLDGLCELLTLPLATSAVNNIIYTVKLCVNSSPG
jgi:hypothetical protein